MKLFKAFRFLFFPPVNWVISRALRPFGRLLPEKLRFPVVGFFRVRIDRTTSIRVEGHYTSLVTRLLFWKGVSGFEYDNVRTLIPLLKDARVFIDIGANIGYYSLVAAAINPGLKIIAFEPFPDAFEVMNRNIRANGFSNIHTERLALSNVTGQANFFYKVNKDFPHDKYQLAGDIGLVDYYHGDMRTTQVMTTTLDDYVTQNNLGAVDIMKVDTETTEHLVLKGGLDTLRRFSPIIQSEVLTGYNETQLEEVLRDLGYSFYKVKGAKLVQRSTLQEGSEQKTDYFFVPHGKEDAC